MCFIWSPAMVGVLVVGCLLLYGSFAWAMLSKLGRRLSSSPAGQLFSLPNVLTAAAAAVGSGGLVYLYMYIRGIDPLSGLPVWSVSLLVILTLVLLLLCVGIQVGHGIESMGDPYDPITIDTDNGWDLAASASPAEARRMLMEPVTCEPKRPFERTCFAGIAVSFTVFGWLASRGVIG